MAKLNITQAANEWGIARSTLQRAVKRGEVSVTKGKNGYNAVDSSEMVRVYGAAKERSAVSVGAAVGTDILTIKVEMIERENRLLRERVNDLKEMMETKEKVIVNQREIIAAFFRRLPPPSGRKK